MYLWETVKLSPVIGPLPCRWWLACGPELALPHACAHLLRGRAWGGGGGTCRCPRASGVPAGEAGAGSRRAPQLQVKHGIWFASQLGGGIPPRHMIVLLSHRDLLPPRPPCLPPTPCRCPELSATKRRCRHHPLQNQELYKISSLVFRSCQWVPACCVTVSMIFFFLLYCFSSCFFIYIYI